MHEGKKVLVRLAGTKCAAKENEHQKQEQKQLKLLNTHTKTETKPKSTTRIEKTN
jgi:hypothetical protein